MSDANGNTADVEVAAAAPPKSLVTKLAEVMAAVERIAKRGRNDFHGYNYATEADIADAIRQELAARNIMLIPGAGDYQRVSVGDKGSVLTTLAMTFTFFDGDSGAEITRPWFGAGTDKEDKGLYKAFTGGEKYFLLKTFLIATGDDPEREGGGPASRAERRDAARAAGAREAAEHGPYSDRERERAAKGVPMTPPRATTVPAPVLNGSVIDKTTGEVKAEPVEPWLAPSWAEILERRAKLPPELQAVVPDDEGMHTIPPSEAMDNIAFMVDAIVRKAKERKISAKEWGEIMELFFGSKRARLLNNQGTPVAKLSPFFVHALYLHMDMGKP